MFYTHGFVAAADVIANTRRADRVLIGHDAANRHTIADMVVGHQYNFVGGARAHTDLVQRAIVCLTEHWNLVIENLHTNHESGPHLPLSLAQPRQQFFRHNEKAPDHQARGSKVCLGKRATRLSNRALARTESHLANRAGGLSLCVVSSMRLDSA
jgi:hypothetical protein